ncbi:P-loop NTPase [Thalassospiraceae bacterium LMO-JJ14]|nr:P-loop NTPase [Thalassospiraceae bacterium LMO-JJ14]
MIALRKEETPDDAGMSHAFLAFAADRQTAETLGRGVEAEGLPAESVIEATLDEAIESLAAMPTPSTLVVDLGASGDIMTEVARLAEVCDAGAQVILLGAVNDLHVYREVLAAGVTDYLAKPFTYHEFSACLHRARPPQVAEAVVQMAPDVVQTDAVCVIGVRGGVGASTVAANAAWFAAEQQQKNVTLIDMDLTFGTQALMLDVDPGGGLAEAMREPGRMDELFVKRALVSLGERFRVMASETDPAKGDLADAQAFGELLDFVRDACDLVIVDMPRATAVAHPGMLEAFSRIVLVAEPSLAAMRDSVRLASLIGAVSPAAQVSVVLGRQGMAPREELSVKTFEEGSGLKVSARIPFDPKSAMRSEADGKCILQSAGRSKLGRALVGVAELMTGAERKSGGGLFAKFRRAPKTAAQATGGRDVR